MKDKDKAFYEAMDTLQAQGINVFAAAHWHDRQLRSVLSPDLLKGWRRWFFKTRIRLEIGAHD